MVAEKPSETLLEKPPLENGNTKPTTTKRAPLFHPLSRRFHMILLLIFGFGCTTFSRVHMAITMTCMVNSTAVALIEEELYGGGEKHVTWSPFGNISEPEPLFFNQTIVTSDGQCDQVTDDGHHVVVDYGGSLPWTHDQQNFIFSGTFWGALIVALPSMKIVQEGSPKIVLLVAMVIYVSSSVITPFVANNWGVFPTWLARVSMGFGEGVVIPTINAIISNWFPTEERSTALALFTTGNQMAGAAGQPAAAALCASQFGWPAIFYGSTLMGTIWITLWSLAAASRPSDCKVMTTAEREYLTGKVVTPTKKKYKAPYRAIFMSAPFWAQLQSHFVINMMMSLLQIYLPSYLKDVLRLKVVANGAFIALPNVCQILAKVAWGMFMDYTKARKMLTPTFCVKLSQGIANFGGSIIFICVCLFIDCTNPATALFLFCLMYCCLSTFTSGFYTSLLSLAPRYTATISSMSQFAAMIGRLVTPFVVGFVKKTGSEDEWKALFYLMAAVSAISGAIFIAFGSGEVQDWGRDDPEVPVAPVHIPLVEATKSTLDLNVEVELE